MNRANDPAELGFARLAQTVIVSALIVRLLILPREEIPSIDYRVTTKSVTQKDS